MVLRPLALPNYLLVTSGTAGAYQTATRTIPVWAALPVPFRGATLVLRGAHVVRGAALSC